MRVTVTLPQTDIFFTSLLSFGARMNNFVLVVVWTCECGYVYVWRPEVNVCYPPPHSPFYLLKQGLTKPGAHLFGKTH